MVEFYGITPTIEEYLQASVFPNPYKMWTDRSGETTFYFNVNIVLAGVSAYRKSGETLSALRMFYALKSTPAMLAAGGLAAQAYLLGKEVSRYSQQSKMELVTGVPSASDTEMERMIKLSFA